MGTGRSGLKGAGSVRQQAQANIKGMSGYQVTAANGDTLEFYFSKSNGVTLYGNSIGDVTHSTPNDWNEQQMIQAIQNNGGQAVKYTKNQLLQMEIARLQDRIVTNQFHDQYGARNRIADQISKEYRNHRRALRNGNR